MVVSLLAQSCRKRDGESEEYTESAEGHWLISGKDKKVAFPASRAGGLSSLPREETLPT